MYISYLHIHIYREFPIDESDITHSKERHSLTNVTYGLPTIGRLLKNIGLFCKI